MDIHLCLSEDVSISIEAASTTITQDIITLTATEDIALHMAVIHLNMCTASLVNVIECAFLIICTGLLRLAASNGGNLTATEDAVSNQTAPYCDIGKIDTTVIIITATKKVTTV